MNIEEYLTQKDLDFADTLMRYTDSKIHTVKFLLDVLRYYEREGKLPENTNKLLRFIHAYVIERYNLGGVGT